MSPDSLYDVHVRAVAWPTQSLEVLSFNPGLGVPRRVTGCIVLLENEVLASVPKTIFDGLRKTFLKHINVVDAVESLFDLDQLTNTVEPDAAPEHNPVA